MLRQHTRDVIARLLTNLGSRQEVEQYLKHYVGTETRQMAVVKVGGRVLQEQLDVLASSLAFLYEVGLHPVVIHGAGGQLNLELQRAGIVTQRIDGLRVTTPEVLDRARRVFVRENNRLVSALERLGTRARPVTSAVFEAKPATDTRLGLVGEVVRVDTAPLQWCIDADQLPVIAPLGESPEGQILNLNADVAARELSWALQPHKVVFLTDTGGLLDDKQRILPAVNLVEDYDNLLSKDWVNGGMRLKLQQIKELLERLPVASSVSITSPEQLARELFTYRGAGTLLRIGERILCFERFDQVDCQRLRSLLETCFRGELDPRYFETKRPLNIYLADSYRGTALLTREGGIPYLDKFAVTAEAQGAGVGGSLWRRLRRDHPQLFWRARVNNPINSWYFNHAGGTHRQGDWVVFWYGLEDFAQVQRCTERALAMPPSIASSRGPEIQP